MEKLQMEKVISGLLTVNGCDPEKDTYVDITRLSCRLGFKVVNAELKRMKRVLLSLLLAV